MKNVIQFPVGTAARDERLADRPGGEQDVFSADQAANLTYDDGRLYGWASREGRLPAHYWELERSLTALVLEQGVILAARRLGLAVPFVRGWSVEIGIQSPGRAVQAAADRSAASPEAPAGGAPVSPLADDAFPWLGAPACA
jgi:hypothetical protein